MTLRRFVFPCCGCPSFGVVDFVDFEVLIYFLQCSSFGEVDFVDFETRFCFPFLGVLVLVKPILLALRY